MVILTHYIFICLLKQIRGFRLARWLLSAHKLTSDILNCVMNNTLEGVVYVDGVFFVQPGAAGE